MPPVYDPESVRPMWEELQAVGIQPLSSPEAVEAWMDDESTGLMVINSVCGCAAGSCRPGVMAALQHDRIPDRLGTVFAGMDTEAVEAVRSYLTFRPSSPNVILFKGKTPVFALQRAHIETMAPEDVAEHLRNAFDEYCSRPGPSIPAEEYQRIIPVQECGSTIPLYSGD